MTEKRIQFSNIVYNQLPAYVREEFPLVAEFLSQYYLAQEFQGAPIDLIQNIDKYIKVDESSNQVDSATLLSSVSSFDDTLVIDIASSPTGTDGFPEKYGILKIDDEIITYTGKTFNSFTGCVRGFCGITSYRSSNNPDQLVFSTSESSDHSAGSVVYNLSSLFLKEFLLKIKYQLTPGFENRTLFDNINESLFIKQAKDFYRSKGTDESFEILFKSLYGEDVSIIRPKDYLFRPSDAHYQVTKDLVVESIEGNPENLINSTLKQDEYLNFTKAYAPVTKVEKISSKEGKEYYRLSIDSNYDRDLIVDGALYGEFKVHTKTKVIGQHNTQSTVIDVDSTIGFPNSGELYVVYNDGTNGVISYSSKSINQFFGCANITGVIEDSSDVHVNTYAYGQSFVNPNENIKVRITSSIKEFDLVDDTYYLKKGYNSQIKTLGVYSEDFASNNWLFNISSAYEVESISLVDNSDKTYRINTKFDHILRIGDSIKIINSAGVEKTSTVIDVISDKSFNVKGQGILSLADKYTVKRNILKANSQIFPNISTINANIQNVYNDADKIIIASPSLPYYNNQSINPSSKQVIFSGTFDSDLLKITSTTDHGFYTGDAVYYTPEKRISESYDADGNIIETSTILSSLFDEGIYYVKRIDSTTIKLSLSRSNLYNSVFVSVDNPVTVKSNKLEYLKFKSKTLNTQKLLREISLPVNDGSVYKTEPGFTGILINGVEILNYKSTDAVYYGSIEEVQVTAAGFNYDIINPPVLSITDNVGSGASAYCAVKGSLNEIRIIDPGFDYDETPVIKISGGNGIGAKAYANMKLVDHKSTFNSELNSAQVSISNDTIGFGTYHKFRNAEKVIYKTNGQRFVGGLSTDSSYYVSVQSPTQIKLHNTLNDAVSGINTVQLTSYGIGNHEFKSFNKKSILGSINVENPGSGYENKKRTVSSTVSGINTSINLINIPNHNFQSGEIVKYSAGISPIGGLIDNNEYYVTKFDEDSFKLSEVGTGSISKDFYYVTKQYTNLTSIGSGIHSFNYPEIVVEVIGNVASNTFKAVVQPIFRGEITSVHLENTGSGYGSPEILNHIRKPLITLNSGSGAKVTPIILNGEIVEVLVNSSGSGYNSPPDLRINGEGFGAVLTPVIENGHLVEVKVLESGIGYRSNTTDIIITSSGSSSEFEPRLQSWNVNLFQKNLPIVSDDDGFISEGRNDNFGLEYSHIYAPRKLREIIYASDQGGNTLYGRKDLRKSGNKEISSTDHSPIIGWAYDGNPIYGPYGYSTKQGGVVSQMKSGYKIDIKHNRPPVSAFPEGFFIEDYTYFQVSDETVLDENNGRFCVTPEYPNGTYAYFATLSTSSADSSGTFSGYKSPVFPYLIGDTFKSRPIEFNFKKSSNQDDIDLNQTKWLRNTNPYNIIENGVSYSYLEFPNKLNQTVDIKYASPGSVEEINLVSGGSGYKVGDKLVFDNTETDGYNAAAEVSRISGKEVNSISVASTSIYDVEFYPSSPSGTFIAFAENPHNLKNIDLVSVSGLNTTSSLIEGSYNIGVSTNTISLTAGVGTTGITGLVTYFSVAGNLNYPNIRENDILKIGSEDIKVLNIDTKSSRIRVLRAVNGTVGSSHSITDILYENPRKLTINSGFRSQYDYKINREIYFNPIDSVGLGTLSGVGIGTIITFSNPGAGITQIFIPTRSIYISNHKLQTGDQLVYSTNNGSPIGISTNGISTSVSLSDQSIVYVAKISEDLIGISTFKVGLGTEGTFVGITSETKGMGLLYFTELGSGHHHSFKTTYDVLTGSISKNNVTVSTAQTHGLLNGDKVFIDVNPSISTSVTIKYNDYTRKLLVNPKNFTSVGIDTNTNTITIPNHRFENGQKVVHTSSSPAGGLENNKEYFIIIVDNDKIKLSDTYYESINAKPEVVGITSSSDGTLSLINPPIKVYRNSSVVFDLSDSSLSYTQQSTRYPAFNLEFFKDSKFTERYDSNSDNIFFEVQKVGTVGVTSDAKITLEINENTPENLYYNLIPVYDGNLPENKKLISVDTESLSNNEIKSEQSQYNGEYSVVVGSTTSFTYTIAKTPESNSYNSEVSSIEYETNSLSAKGSISKVKILNKGQNYYSLPQISNVISEEGSGAILEVSSTSIGKVKTTKIKDIGFDFSSDLTVRPSVSVPQVIKVDPLSSFQSIGVTSFGRGYTSTPKLIVLDGKTREIVPEVDLKFTLGNTNVEILENSFALNNTIPTILPINNSNGVGISSIKYNSTTKNVTVYLSVGFSTANSFPFAINDKVLIENISIGINSDAKGFNSSDYEYQLFTLNSVTENLGGFGSVTYSLDGLLSDSEYPGIFDSTNSSGRIIAEKHFPTFDVVLKKNDYLIGETVKSNSYVGIVEDWNSKSNYVKILSRNNFEVGEVIVGSSSRTQGIASSITRFDAYFNLGATSKFASGWKSDAGVLNNNLQRVQDSFYYQNFSYSIKSKVDYDTWNDAVSTLNHTSGFKKFSDYQLESKLSEENSNSMVVGLSTDLTSFEVISDIIGVANLNCVYDFDLVRENSLQIGSQTFSDEIIFSNRVLTDYSESIGNRVLSIDDISVQFNSNPRPTRFSEVHRFDLGTVRSQKYITYIRDKRFTSERQILLVTALIDNIGNTFLNQYARVESTYDMGSFDLAIDGSEGVLLFYPTKYSVNDFDVTTLSYNINDNLLGVGNTNFGGVIDIQSSSVNVSSASTTIVSIANTYRAAKVLVSISSTDNKYEFDEFSVIHDGTNIDFLEYGQLTNHSTDSYSSSGLGTYYPYFTGSQLNVDFIPNVGVTGTVNTIQVIFGGTSVVGVGTHDMKHSRLEGRSVSIASTSTPLSVVISEYPDVYDTAYFVVQVSDNANNSHQISEVTLVTDESEIYITEYANIETLSSLGTIGAQKSGSNIQLTFTPLENIALNVKVYLNALRYEDDKKDSISFLNSEIQTDYGTYEGTDRDIKRSFNLTHKNYPIFERSFGGNNSSIVDTTLDSITIPNHFFVTGELVKYSHAGAGSTQAIGIASTSFAGIGVTDKLPENVYIVKVNSNTVKLARSAEDALKSSPKILDITSVGIGTSHHFTSTNQNAKVIVAIDNIIQSPVVSTAITTTLSKEVTTTDDIINFNEITSFFGGDLIQIEDEIMRIEGVGIGSTNAIRVRRPWLGTVIAGYSTGSLVTKVTGNYNIVNNTLNFVEAPYGNIPLSTTTNSPDERDWIGISTGSRFQGRSFMRSGIINSSNEAYHKNYVFDDISEGFNGITKTFTLNSNEVSVSGISSENAIVLINDIFQGSGLTYDYNLEESSGITTIRFTGAATSISYDVNNASIPRGGIIVSVGSTEGFGYQPLVSAGGTAIVSIAGTISSISIGNSGSGYRAGSQIVRVGVATSTTGTPNTEFIGTATVNNGNIVSVAITNPGTGYTTSNPPYVVFDEPLSYSNLPLIYSSSSSGIGTEATINVVVGQGSSVIDFEIINTGYGYGDGEILTVPVGGSTGIPTTGTSFKEFQISIQKTFTDKFTGWSIGELQVLDRLDDKFDGETVSFPLTLSDNLISIRSSKGSNINVQDTLLVFINDILQEPGKGYIFSGGSIITFTEPPKVGDKSKILFYRGSGSVDVVDVNILETVKVGDELKIGYDSSIGQSPTLQEDPRTVTSINSTDLVNTNPYFGPGNTPDETFTRPVTWCRQTEDKIINETEVGKDRILYEAIINPTSYLIQPVGIGSTIVYVDNIRPFFNQINESNTSLLFQNSITIISQDNKVGAYATAIVSAAGTISSIQISDGGVGYTTSPTVTIQDSVGIGTTLGITATAVASISSGIVTSINIENPGIGYTISNPPIVLIESPTLVTETNTVLSYQGDFGFITGISTTSVGVASTGIVFDFYIPTNSFLRNGSITGVTTISGIQTGDYFVVYNSNIGNPTTSLNSSGSVVGLGITFIDNIYQVASVSIAQTSTIGVGVTYVLRVTTSVSNYNGLSSSGISSFFGEYSWGKIILDSRTKSNEYEIYNLNGVSGLSTSTILKRTNSLRYSNYIS
jgi:hypothetical protein